MDQSILISIEGLVQGVGFRPFIYLLAKRWGVNGWVKNTNKGVEIFALAPKSVLSGFIRQIRSEAPVASEIRTLNWQPVDGGHFSSFTIERSENLSDEITWISPDIAVCPDCLSDIQKRDHRWHYPFVNCTNCGPRYSIIKEIPYDRSQTSMEDFRMCRQCRSEYENIEDRRFHAQPVACLNCGPVYKLQTAKETITGETDLILETLEKLISSGKIIAIKGTGGYHLACDAFNEKAVSALRSRKLRDGKPFALMFRDILTIQDFARVNKIEEVTLLSWRRPIVILELKNPGRYEKYFHLISSGLSTIGAFLPYMPLHHLLFQHFKGPAIVLTSGNLSADPIIIDDQEAKTTFRSVADAVLSYNREIVNRIDDSVVRVINNHPRMIRRSRGYVPAPVPVSVDVNNIVAFGAELSSVFAVGRNHNVFPGPYIGDLKTVTTSDFFESALKDFIRLFRVKPELMACDLHPSYFSTKFAEKQNQVPVVYVQHHHAHIASCMAEYGLDEKVIGVAFDGTGYGDDGKIWGAEFMISDLTGYERVMHFDYIPLPGGDKATEEPWRTAIAYLCRVFGDNFSDLPLPFLKKIRQTDVMTIKNMIDSGFHCPEVSSAGRLFDAVAAVLGLVTTSTFQAEAPMRLESLVLHNYRERYSTQIDTVISFDTMFRELILDLTNNVNLRIIATKFHNTIISIIFDSVLRISEQKKITQVVLSGGVFQNRYILEKTEKLIRNAGFQVYSNQKVPVNDGGLALGQIIVAAKRRSMGCV